MTLVAASGDGGKRPNCHAPWLHILGPSAVTIIAAPCYQ